MGESSCCQQKSLGVLNNKILERQTPGGTWHDLETLRASLAMFEGPSQKQDSCSIAVKLLQNSQVSRTSAENIAGWWFQPL